jgi:hypothetical protein
MFTHGILERNKPGKVGRKMQARQYQNNEVVNKGDRPYTPWNTAVLRAQTQMCLYGPQRSAVKHCSTWRTNTDVSVRSAEKCTLSVERSKEAQLFVRFCA